MGLAQMRLAVATTGALHMMDSLTKQTTEWGKAEKDAIEAWEETSRMIDALLGRHGATL